MKKFAHYAIILLVAFSLSQCSSDESITDSEMLLVNGAEFSIGTNSSSHTYNRITSKSETSLSLEISENTTSGARIISIGMGHEPNAANGTYILKNNEFRSGVAIPALLDEETGRQISGGTLSPPTGTISITYKGDGRYELSFNDVVMDPGTATETTINGKCVGKFKLQPDSIIF